MWSLHVKPAQVDSRKVCAHVAVNALVEADAPASVDVYGYHVDFVERLERRFGRTRMLAGIVRVRSQLTRGSAASDSMPSCVITSNVVGKRSRNSSRVAETSHSLFCKIQLHAVPCACNIRKLRSYMS